MVAMPAVTLACRSSIWTVMFKARSREVTRGLSGSPRNKDSSTARPALQPGLQCRCKDTIASTPWTQSIVYLAAHIGDLEAWSHDQKFTVRGASMCAEILKTDTAVQ